jgi:hypothetical protein
VYDIIGWLCVLLMLSLIGLTWWAVLTFVEPGQPKPPKRVRDPRYIAPRETPERVLLKGISTILIIEILFGGSRDH